METEEIVKRALTLLHRREQTIPKEKVSRGAPSTPPASFEKIQSLRQAYRDIWDLSKEDPIEAYASAWEEIKDREREVPPEVALKVLREEAQVFFNQTSQCPFCRSSELHLPPASASEELWTG